ncbi:hypothetical protein ISF72_30260, partial [Burkholderia pseudomallei]|nr:hypothetical protein [Burkholderia pseudomallei]
SAYRWLRWLRKRGWTCGEIADHTDLSRTGGGHLQAVCDWGYLPPEPAGIAPVKGVIPLPLKKR